MDNNICPLCNSIVEDSDVNICPICGYMFDGHNHLYTKKVLKEKIENDSPLVIEEFDLCPICGKERTNNEDVCSNCGFVFVPIGFLDRVDNETGESNDYINRFFQKHIREINKKKYSNKSLKNFIIPIIAFVILSVLLSFALNSIFLSLVISLIVGVIIAVVLNNNINKKYDIAIEAILQKEKAYKDIQLNWRKKFRSKEQQLYGKSKTMIIDKWCKQPVNNKYLPYMNMSVKKSKITFFPEKGIIKYNNRLIRANNIVDCTLIDDGKGKVITKTEVKPKTSSVVGRAVVGQVVAGPVGAVIGGLTAKKKVENKEIEEHDFNIYVTTANIDKPLLKLEFGENVDNAREVYSMFILTINSKV